MELLEQSLGPTHPQVSVNVHATPHLCRTAGLNMQRDCVCAGTNAAMLPIWMCAVSVTKDSPVLHCISTGEDVCLAELPFAITVQLEDDGMIGSA